VCVRVRVRLEICSDAYLCALIAIMSEWTTDRPPVAADPAAIKDGQSSSIASLENRSVNTDGLNVFSRWCFRLSVSLDR
jgi:hypothetical protein